MNEIIINGVMYTSKKEALEVLSTIQDNIKTPVKDLNPGERFFYKGIEWIKLDDTYGGVLVLAVNCNLEDRFNDGLSTNWAESSLRQNLNATENGHFMVETLKYIDKNDLVEFERDLTTDDGMTDYGTCKDFISLYTCDEYRKYRKFIPKDIGDHLTITAESLSCEDLIRFVDSDGRLKNNLTFCGYHGVLPLCVLKPDVDVEVK